MNWICKLLAVALAAVAFLSLDVHAQSTAPAELNLGVEAFKQSAYAEAVQHLEKAVSLDPENQDARMYLAKAFAKQYKPHVDTPENIHLAELAIEQYPVFSLIQVDRSGSPKCSTDMPCLVM